MLDVVNKQVVGVMMEMNLHALKFLMNFVTTRILVLGRDIVWLKAVTLLAQIKQNVTL